MPLCLRTAMAITFKTVTAFTVNLASNSKMGNVLIETACLRFHSRINKGAISVRLNIDITLQLRHAHSMTETV